MAKFKRTTYDEYIALCYKPVAWHYFDTSKEAWDFMRKCDAENRQVGYPDFCKTKNKYTVQESWKTATR